MFWKQGLRQSSQEIKVIIFNLKLNEHNLYLKYSITTFFGAMMTKNETINQINEDVNANNRKRNGMNVTRRDQGSRRTFGDCRLY